VQARFPSAQYVQRVCQALDTGAYVTGAYVMSAASAQPSSTPQIPSPLARDQAVMIFVDNQTGLMASVQSLHPEQLKPGMVALRDVAAIYRLPVILTASDPSNPQGPGPMVPELTQAFPQSQVI